MSLLYWAFDELTVAFYLSERKYTTQAYGHLRTVFDLLEKAELFFLQPHWADVWGGDDKKKILKELSPGGVRKKLGKPKFNPMYSLLSEMGTHGTFGAVRKRVVRRRRKDEVRPEIAMWIGGVAWDGEVDFAVSSCIIVTMDVLILTGRIFKDRLNKEEVVSTVQARSREAGEFLEKHFVEAQKKAGLDMSAMVEILKEMKNPVI